MRRSLQPQRPTLRSTHKRGACCPHKWAPRHTECSSVSSRAPYPPRAVFMPRSCFNRFCSLSLSLSFFLLLHGRPPPATSALQHFRRCLQDRLQARDGEQAIHIKEGGSRRILLELFDADRRRDGRLARDRSRNWIPKTPSQGIVFACSLFACFLSSDKGRMVRQADFTGQCRVAAQNRR